MTMTTSILSARCVPRVPCSRCGGKVPVAECDDKHPLILEAIREGVCWMCKCKEQRCPACGGEMFMGYCGPQCEACEGDS
jgi:hypothetical protein